MATGSDVTTNPRWRPEVTSQIQDGGPPPPPPVPRNVLPQLLPCGGEQMKSIAHTHIKYIYIYMHVYIYIYACIYA